MMPAIAGSSFTDTELLSGARKGLYERSRLLSPDATLAAIQDLKLWVADELSFEEAASASFGRILNELWHAEYLDQLPPLLNKFERLAAAYFVRRGSVTAFHGFCNAWREGLLRRILLFAEEGPELTDHGHPPVPYALLAGGSLGRHEQTIEESDPYFLVWTQGEARYFERFAYRVMAILDQLGVEGKDGNGTVARVLWRGSLDAWDDYAAAHGELEKLPGRLEILADLRQVCGDEAVGEAAIRTARSYLELCRDDAHPQLAKRAVAAPVALGIFGGMRVERTGEHRGCLDLAKSGLSPLVAAVRVLAVQHKLDPGPTLERLAALRALGVLEQGLVERLKSAYHLLAGLKIGKEIALEQPYVNPVALSVVEQQKLKGALESVRQLQRVIKRANRGKTREAHCADRLELSPL